MRYFVNATEYAEPPKKYLRWYERALDTGSVAFGIPEVNHPNDYWEVIDLKKRIRDTNYPDFVPRSRYIETSTGWLILDNNMKDYDFDKLPLECNVVTHLINCDRWFYRVSTTGRGIHILDEHDLSMYDDQYRQIATEIRGYSWYWKVKNGEKSNIWQRGSKFQAIKFQGMNKRTIMRRKPPKHKHYQKTTKLF